jgi:hypothetical protein
VLHLRFAEEVGSRGGSGSDIKASSALSTVVGEAGESVIGLIFSFSTGELAPRGREGVDTGGIEGGREEEVFVRV